MSEDPRDHRHQESADDPATASLTSSDATAELIIAGVIGAVVGGGLAWLAAQALREPGRPTVHLVRDRMRGGRESAVRQGQNFGRQVGRYADEAGDATDEVGRAARRAARDVGEVLARSQRDLERRFERGVRNLRRAAGRAGRRLG